MQRGDTGTRSSLGEGGRDPSWAERDRTVRSIILVYHMLTHMLICLSISVFEYRVALEVVGILYATPRILNLQFHLLPPSPVESDSHRGYACGVATATPARETNFKRIFENTSRLYPSRDILSPAYSDDYSPSRVPRGLVLFLTYCLVI